ncbi:hypothetical protein N7474_008154 [Penicillium riverlandense]|uniref:uncharacterized protein n=1 Tax=Penicillium riverlandense TaxID=1903569 RepID=UPI002548E76F|nr:uncharacterized protein N7474_008154 [Penicillium riverlandense]KAJ5811853.1 hypothetical protein N7474_008154 [Penicillium riverlandense]
MPPPPQSNNNFGLNSMGFRSDEDDQDIIPSIHIHGSAMHATSPLLIPENIFSAMDNNPYNGYIPSPPELLGSNIIAPSMLTQDPSILMMNDNSSNSSPAEAGETEFLRQTNHHGPLAINDTPSGLFPLNSTEQLPVNRFKDITTSEAQMRRGRCQATIVE